MAGGDKGRAYDQRGNVRPADKRFLGKGKRTGNKATDKTDDKKD